MTRFFPYVLMILIVLMSHGEAASSDKGKQPVVVNTIGMKFVSVPIAGGKPVLFSIWKTRVKDFEAFVADTKYDATKDMYPLSPHGAPEHNVNNWKLPGFDQTGLHPVCGVSYADAIAFCAWLSKKEAKHYRLPTDHEWSCAVGIGDKETGGTPRARHGKIEGVYPWGAQWPPPQGAGNYAGEECEGQKSLPGKYGFIKGYRDGFVFTSPVGSFDPNPLGLYDLGGNLWEWCDDRMDADRVHRVLRGGSWGDHVPACLLASFRNHDLPTNRGVVFGFRVVLEQ